MWKAHTRKLKIWFIVKTFDKRADRIKRRTSDGPTSEIQSRFLEEQKRLEKKRRGGKSKRRKRRSDYVLKHLIFIT